MKIWTVSLAILRIAYGLLWLSFPLATLLLNLPMPKQPTEAATAFWDAIEATGFMVPLLGATYFVGGVLLLWRRTAPLGLAVLSPPLLIASLFDAFLARQSGPWIVMVVVHLLLMWDVRSAYAGLWAYEPRRALPARL
jgi:hypothetical protein